MGLPPGSADTGDSVTIAYSAYDLTSGAPLRENRTVTFAIGDGGSGLGDTLEGAVRGHRANDTFEVTVRSDPSLDYSERVEANRTLAPIPVQQSAPRADFERYVGPATANQTFDAYGIYTGQVTEVTNDTVSFRILAQDGQQDAVPSVGATLVTTVTATQLLRRLDPVASATFTIQPPSPFQPTTPLGLQPGSYKVAEPTADKLVFLRSASGQGDLVGRDLRVVVRVLDVTDTQEAVPTTGNFGVRHSPQVNGDPASVLANGGQPIPSGPTAP
jgi:FKBP-type peptidyl-prolyl cis-trans isomerase 2